MRKNPKARKIAARLLDYCRDEAGRLSAETTEGILASLREDPPSDYRDILRYLAFLAEREISSTTATVTVGASIGAESQELIRRSFSKEYGRELAVETSVDPSMIAGTKVQVGDDVFENSIPSRLAGLGNPSN
ncbi:MAG: F0F1 ATP synthase subunit delta [Verrucomicrobiota bacterium]